MDMKRLRWVNTLIDSYETGKRMLPPKKVAINAAPDKYNLVSSLADDGYHYPALDIDVPCRYVPSSTEGHGHLYFDTVAMTWEKYRILLDALADAGIIERKYNEHSRRNGMTLLRPEHVKKTKRSVAQ